MSHEGVIGTINPRATEASIVFFDSITARDNAMSGGVDLTPRPEDLSQELARNRSLPIWRKAAIAGTAFVAGFTALGVTPKLAEANGFLLTGSTKSLECIDDSGVYALKVEPAIAVVNTEAQLASIAQPQTGETAAVDQELPQDVEIAIFPDGSRLLAVTAEACEVQVPKDRIQKQLDARVTPDENGNYNKVPVDQKFTFATHYAILGEFEQGELHFDFETWFQGLNIAHEVVDGDLFIYFLQEDRTGVQYFIPVCAGSMDDNKKMLRYRIAEKGHDFPFGLTFNTINTREMMKVVKKNNEEVVAFSILASKMSSRWDYGKPHSQEYFDHNNTQIKIARDFIAFSQSITDGKTLAEALAEAPDNVKSLINRRVKSGEFEMSEIPLIQGLFPRE